MPDGRLLLLATVFVAGCSSAQDPHGSPVLLSVYWIIGGQSQLVWTPSSATVAQAPAGVQEVDFVFDRELDGNRIEDTVTQNGTPTTVPKTDPPITVSWPDESTTMSTPPASLPVLYNSEPVYGGSTAYVFLRPIPIGLPSSDTITFALDKTGLTSAYGDPMLGPSQISVATGPFSASFQLPMAGDASTAVSESYMLPVVFSNRIAGASTLAPYITASAPSGALPVSVLGSATDPTIVYLLPASCLGGWPVGVPIEVQIAAGAPDAFGVPLAADAKTTFMAAGPAGTTPDGGCGPVDAGTDAGGD